MFDRKTSNPFILEKGYIDLIAYPAISLYCTFAPELQKMLITKGIDENRKFILNKIEESSYKSDINDADEGENEKEEEGIRVHSPKKAASPYRESRENSIIG